MASWGRCELSTDVDEHAGTRCPRGHLEMHVCVRPRAGGRAWALGLPGDARGRALLPAPGAQGGGTEQPQVQTLETLPCVSCVTPSLSPRLGLGDVALRCGEEPAEITGRKVLVEGRCMWPSEQGGQSHPRGCQDPPGRPQLEKPGRDTGPGLGAHAGDCGRAVLRAGPVTCQQGDHRTLTCLPYEDRGVSDTHFVQLG